MTGLGRRRLVRKLSARDPAQCWEAATALAHVDDPRTLRRVERLLESRSNDQGRAAAAYVLGFSGSTDVSEALVGRLADTDESVLVRAHAAEALGHLLQYQPVLAEIRTTIVACLRDVEPEVRFWSAFAAGALELQESRSQLERLRGDDTEIAGWWTIAEEAGWALRCLDGEDDPPLPRPRPEA